MHSTTKITNSTSNTADNGYRLTVDNSILPQDCMGVRQEQVRQSIQHEITANTVVLWCKSWCNDCAKLKELFDYIEKLHFMGSKKLCVVHYLDKHLYGDLISRELFRMTGQQSVPSVFINSIHIGGYQDTMRRYENGTLIRLLEENNVKAT
jgi:glutaredoxin